MPNQISQQAVAKVLFTKVLFTKILFSSAIALTISSSISSGSAAHAQHEPAASPVAEQLAEAASPSREEKIARLEAAVLTVDNSAGEYNTKDKIDMLRQLAVSYSTLGEQTRAIELLEKAVQLAQNSDSDRRPTAPFRVAPTYIRIGEADLAESLLAPATAPGDRNQTNQLIQLAEAYAAADHAELAAAKLSLAADSLGTPADWESGNSFVYYIGKIAENYGQLPESEQAQAGLQQLMTLTEAGASAYGPDTYNKAFATTLSQLAIAQSLQNNTAEVPNLLAQAMARIQDGEQTGYITANVARAYGYAPDKAVAEQALADITQLATVNLLSVDPIGPVSALSAIAIAQKQIGNPAQSAQTLEIISENFGDSLYMLGALLSIHTQMDNCAGQEAVIQQMFDKLPELRGGQFVVSDVTAGYAGISGLVEAYRQTTNHDLAAERLALLESFFREVQFDPMGLPGQLALIASAAAAREEYATAQRLLTEATQALAVNNDLSESERAGGIYRLTYSYGLIGDDRVRQAGFDELQKIADNTLAPPLNREVTGTLTRARAAL